MGIIQQQSVKGFIYSYLGVIIGFITTGYLMPKFLLQSEIGLLRVLVSYATLLAQFSSLGFSIVAMRMFPYFRDPSSKNHGFFGLFSFISMVGFFLSMIGFYIYYQLNLQNDISPLLNQYILWIVPLSLFILLFTLSDSYQRALYDAIRGTILKELVQRVLILIVLVLFIIKLFDLSVLVGLYVLAFAAPPIFMILQLLKNKTISMIPDFSFIDKGLRKKIIGVSAFGLISSFSSILVLNIDVLMVERYIDLSATGVYSIAFFFGTLVLIPARPLTRISAIIVAESFKKNDLENIDLINKKSSITLTIIALLLFLGLAVNMDNIMTLIGEDYSGAYYVILIIAFANVIQMSSGVINQVIFYSEYYKYSTYFILGFAVLITISNMFFIPKYGILGAAIATLISKVIYNFSRILFVKVKLNLNPYQLKTLIPIVISALLYWLQTYIPPFNNYIIDIIIRSSIISISFLITIYVFNVSDDINEWIKSLIKKVLNN